MQKIDFDIYYIKSQSLTLSEKIAENHDIYYWSENVNSLTDKLVLAWMFWKIWELLLKQNYLIFKIPHTRVIWELIVEGQGFIYRQN